MKVLVTGANSLLGSNIVRKLERRGIETRAMIRANAELLSLKGTSPEYFFGNITSREDIDLATKGCDYVIHTAAITEQTLPRLEDYLKVNVGGTQKVLDASVKNKVKRLIYISSTNSIGYGDKKNPGTEEKPAMAPYTDSYYAISKLRAEERVMKAVEEHELNALILNPSFMIGPYDSKPSSGRLLLVGYHERIVFLPAGGRNFVPAEDVATAACNAISRGMKGEKYLLTNANLTYREFYEMVDEITGYKRVKIMLPSWLVKGVGTLGSAASSWGNHVLLNRNNAKILTVRNFYRADKAIRELDFPQSDIRTAISKALNWFRENGYLKN